jgi:hypothetical protein
MTDRKREIARLRKALGTPENGPSAPPAGVNPGGSLAEEIRRVEAKIRRIEAEMRAAGMTEAEIEAQKPPAPSEDEELELIRQEIARIEAEQEAVGYVG